MLGPDVSGPNAHIFRASFLSHPYFSESFLALVLASSLDDISSSSIALVNSSPNGSASTYSLLCLFADLARHSYDDF